MGGWTSKQDIPETPESPHFAEYAKLFQLSAYDPRSPTGNRTPLILPDPLLDPRSPSFDVVDRTPIFAIPNPQSPTVRYKSDNKAFEDSPLSIQQDSLDAGYDIKPSILYDTSRDGVTDELEHSFTDITTRSESLSSKSETIHSIETSSDNICSAERNKKPGKSQRQLGKEVNRRFRKMQQPMLKTVLFKPFVDEDLDNSILHNSPVTSKNLDEDPVNDCKKSGKGNGLQVRNQNVQDKLSTKASMKKLSSNYEKENFQL